MPIHTITVAVHAGDPLSRAGLTAHLQKQQAITVLNGTETEHEPELGDVAVMLLYQVDKESAMRLRKLAVDMNKRVVPVTDQLDESQLELVLDAGIHTIVWRHQATAEHLMKAVRSAYQGEGEVPPDLLIRLLAQLGRMRRHENRDAKPDAGLTERELRVLQFVAKGLNTNEIAAQLSYSERTVKGVLHDIMVRMQLKNRAHAVAFAIREGYI
jgi:DNA-binding NarL/FixJ family response regulator